MPTTTINAPLTHTQVATAGLSYDHVLEMAEFALAMQDALDPVQTGLIGLRGDVAGSMSDTIRVGDVDDIGLSRRFTALASETDAIAPSVLTLGYSEVTVGLYGLAHEESYQGQVLGTNRGVSLTRLMAEVPNSARATLRYLMCVAGATISATVGSDSTTLSVDDALDLATQIRSTPGASNRPVRVTTHPLAVDHLLRSARTEPAFQNSAADFGQLLGITPGQLRRNLLGLGMDWYDTEDVVQSGGGYQGFAVGEGGMGWARAGTAAIRPSGTGRAEYMPEFGLFMEEIARGANGVAAYNARLWVGVALGSSNVHFQCRVKSKTA